jgi:hypothetical protein
MQLIVKQNGQEVNQFQFLKGPIHIGRHPQCHLLLPSTSVSRQHAVIYDTPTGQWMVEDLNSANKTYLNGKVIQKAAIKTGDQLQMGDFMIEVVSEETQVTPTSVQLDETLGPVSRAPQLITRNLTDDSAPPLQLPASRVGDLLASAEAIAQAHGPDGTLNVMLDVLARQFQARRAWCAFRYNPYGPMIKQSGCTLQGMPFQITNEALIQRIQQAREDKRWLLIVHTRQQALREESLSIIIAPIIGAKGDFGAIYIDSQPDFPPYSLGDLDYAMILSIYLAVILENF